MRELNLSEFRKDALQELGNMSASHAANSLSELVGDKVEVTAPKLNVVKIKDLHEIVNGDEKVIPVYSRIFGGISGSVLMLFPSDLGAEKVEKFGKKMMLSLSNALASFFGVKLKPTTTLLPIGKPVAILNHLREKLGGGVEKAVFFRTNFLHNGNVICHFFLSFNYDDVSQIMKTQVPEFNEDYGSFSSMLETFEKLKGVEFKLYDILKETKIPREETRSFLRNFDPEGLKEEPLYKRLISILEACNIGKNITIIKAAPLELVFTITDCTICKLTPKTIKKNSCYTTSTTLGRIFLELLRIGCEVREVECKKNDGTACVHQVNMEQLDVFQILPDSRDLDFLTQVSNNSVELTTLSPGDLKIADLYAHYGITSIDNGVVSITDLGKIFLTFAKNKPQLEKAEQEDKPPWET